MGWGGMLTFMWSAYGVDATLHTWGGGGILTFMWSAYSVDATLHTWGGGGMLTFMWNAYSVDATLHTWVGGHVNVHVKCIQCRCYVAYMGWGGHVKRSCEEHTVSMLRCIHGVGGGMLTFMWSAYSVDATLHTWGGGGMLTFMWSAYGVDATLHTWGGEGHVTVHVKCIRCRCYVAYMGWGGAC